MSSLSIIASILNILIIVDRVQAETLTVETCRLSRNDDGTFFKCEIQQECADADPPNAFEQCISYSFEEVNQEACRSSCCPSLTPASSLSVTDIQQCRTDWESKQLATTLSIVLTILGLIALIMAVSFTLVFGCIRNPYTNKLMWTGCCCCRKQVDFRHSRNAIQLHRKQGQTDGRMYKDDEAAP